MWISESRMRDVERNYTTINVAKPDEDLLADRSTLCILS